MATRCRVRAHFVGPRKLGCGSAALRYACYDIASRSRRFHLRLMIILPSGEGTVARGLTLLHYLISQGNGPL